MNTRLLMTASAAFLAVCGLAALFLPQELLAHAGGAPEKTLVVLVQLLASLLLSFALMNWMQRTSVIGGIYNRSLALGNLMHFTVGALSLVRAAAHHHPLEVIVAAAVYGLFAVAFASLVFGRGLPPSSVA
jgi:hypothetical protein